MPRDPRDTSADRRRRTLTAPSGARVIFPVGTSDMQLLNQQLRWIYAAAFERNIATEYAYFTEAAS